MASTKTIDRIVGWNVYVGQDADGVRKGLDYIHKTENPDAIALQEVSGDVFWLDDWAREKGYRLIVSPSSAPRRSLERQEAQSSCILLRNRVPLRYKGFIRNTVRWRGPKRNLLRPGRTFPTVVAGQPPIRLTNLHMPTGKNTAANRAAWNETVTRLRRLASRWRRRSVWLGDMNNRHTDRSRNSIWDFARSVGGKIYHGEGWIDYAVVRGARGAKVVTKKGLGSDHRYFVVAVSW